MPKIINFSNITFLLFSMVVFQYLSACAAYPQSSAKMSIEEFAADIRGKDYRFKLSKPLQIWEANTSNGAYDQEFGYVGLKYVFEPVSNVCKANGGKLIVNSKIALGNYQVPNLFECRSQSNSLWGFSPGYKSPETKTQGETNYFYVRLMPTIYSTTEIAKSNKEQSEIQEREQKAANERFAVAKQKMQEETRLAEIEKKLRMDRQKTFAQTIRPGDRIKWPVPNSRFIGAGMLVRTEGELAFVQFDNLTFAGQSTRFIRLDELEPFDMNIPAGRLDLK